MKEAQQQRVRQHCVLPCLLTSPRRRFLPVLLLETLCARSWQALLLLLPLQVVLLHWFAAHPAMPAGTPDLLPLLVVEGVTGPLTHLWS